MMAVPRLSERDERMLEGGMGPAARMAMSILLRMAEVEGAGEFVDVARVHVAGLFMSESNVDFAETLVRLDASVVVPTSLNVGPMDEQGWREHMVPPDHAEKGLRLMRAYPRMGCQPTWTCAPYQAGARPALGEQIAWSESSAAVFANSVLGARTNRCAAYLDLCSALTGRAPRTGLLIPENRRGQLLFRLAPLPPALLGEDSLYPVLGFYLGQRAGQKIPVLEGLPRGVTEDQLKALGAAAASSGRVALFHAVGVTPEAPSLEVALQGGPPEQMVDVGLSDLRECRSRMSYGTAGRLDMVLLGCPHFSLEEFRQLASMTRGLDRHPRVQVLITTSRFVRDHLKGTDLWHELERFGVRMVVDSCVLHTPMLTADASSVMSNSGKLCYYAPGLLNREVFFGSLADCVRSAVAGRICREEGCWSA